MIEDFVTFHQKPTLKNPALIVGFGDWSNAGNVALQSIEYVIRKKGATLFAEIETDPFYNFTQNRPIISIKEGRLQRINTKLISFYAWTNDEGGNDLIFLKAQEPDYRWHTFVDILFDLCKQWEVFLIVSLGGMYDDVLHTEAIISGIYSLEQWKDTLLEHGLNLVDYEGPSGIHAFIMQRVQKEQYPYIGLWGHTPLYLRGTNFRVSNRMISILSSLFSFSIETLELERSLKEFEHQMEEALDKNAELQDYIEKIKKLRSGKLQKKDIPKVINIQDFLRHKDSD
jgi:predicted ATP-grasp superfamily ATP-dependent carboligase